MHTLTTIFEIKYKNQIFIVAFDHELKKWTLNTLQKWGQSSPPMAEYPWDGIKLYPTPNEAETILADHLQIED